MKGGRFELAASLAWEVLADDPDDLEFLETSALAAGGLGGDVALEDILARAFVRSWVAGRPARLRPGSAPTSIFGRHREVSDHREQNWIDFLTATGVA